MLLNRNVFPIILMLTIVCLENERVISVVLNRKQLEAWYPDFNTTREIDLHNRNITSIEVDTFASLTNVYTLDLSLNNLTQIDANTFESLVNLNYLDMSYNSLANISKDTFKSLNTLKQLFLLSNNLTVLNSEMLRLSFDFY